MSGDANTEATELTPAEQLGGGTLKWPFFADPVIPSPTPDQVRAIVRQHGSEAPKVLREIERRRKELKRNREADPFTFGYVPEIWKRAEAVLWELGPTGQALCALLVIFGANRSTKTWFAVWAIVRHMLRTPGARVLMLHEDAKQSIDTHQAIFWHYIPRKIRPVQGKRMRTGSAKISYQAGDGFASDVCVLPNGSQVRFGNYLQDLKAWEGGKYTLVNATERFPLPLLEGLDFRIGGAMDPNLRILWDYTAIDGITQTIDFVTRGAKCVESERAVLLPANHKAMKDQDWPAGHMPRMQQGTRAGTKILYFWMGDNAMGGGAGLATKLIGADTVKIERRGYGFARNVVGLALPKFGARNMVPRAELFARMNFARCSKIFLYDPASARNSFMSWFCCDEHGRHALYREWPDKPTYGEWAKRSSDGHKWNGDKGPAQDALGLSVVEQKRIILEAEGWRWDESKKEFVPAVQGVEPETVWMRYMDPRAGAAQRITEREEGGDNLIDIFAEEQRDANDAVIGPPMHFEAAPGLDVAQGLLVINTKYLGYDQDAEIVPLVNEPRFYVAEECEQTIYSLMNFRPGRPKEDDACKDPFDNVRYYFTSDPIYVPPGGLESIKGRRGYK